MLFFKKSVSSYLQYHWLPITFNVRNLRNLTSFWYKILKDGIEIVIKMIIGMQVQKISKSSKEFLFFWKWLFLKKKYNKKRTIVKITINK